MYEVEGEELSNSFGEREGKKKRKKRSGGVRVRGRGGRESIER